MDLNKNPELMYKYRIKFFSIKNTFEVEIYKHLNVYRTEKLNLFKKISKEIIIKNENMNNYFNNKQDYFSQLCSSKKTLRHQTHRDFIYYFHYLICYNQQTYKYCNQDIIDWTNAFSHFLEDQCQNNEYED